MGASFRLVLAGVLALGTVACGSTDADDDAAELAAVTPSVDTSPAPAPAATTPAPTTIVAASTTTAATTTTAPATTTAATTAPPTTPAPPPPPSFDLTRPVSCGMAAPVSEGTVGPDVACLEQRLADVAANVAPFVVDDVFGADTSEVVRQFQTARGLTVDGAVGPQTATSLGIWSPPPPPVQPVAPLPPTGGTDPRFDTCKAAIANGYGPYSRGQTEYDWYRDADSDGIVCER